MSLDLESILVAEFREIMDDDFGGIPSPAHCAAVIRHKAAQLPEGDELWALWHVAHDSEVAHLCEFDGSTCYECYVNPAVAWRAAERLNASAYSQSGRYVVARIPAGVAGCAGSGAVRAGGPVVPWVGGMEGGYTTCEANVRDLCPLDCAPASKAPRRPLSPRKAYRAAQVAAQGDARSRWDDRPAPADMTPICRLYIFGRDDAGGMSIEDIIEADMTASQFQAHFMRKGGHWTFGKSEPDAGRTYSLSVGYYHNGSAFFPWDETATRSRV